MAFTKSMDKDIRLCYSGSRVPEEGTKDGMITARITSEWEDDEGNRNSDLYELETDSGYSPDIAQDLMRRVTEAAKEDRAARIQSFNAEDD